MKIGARVLNLWLDKSFGPSDPNIFSRPHKVIKVFEIS